MIGVMLYYDGQLSVDGFYSDIEDFKYEGPADVITIDVSASGMTQSEILTRYDGKYFETNRK